MDFRLIDPHEAWHTDENLGRADPACSAERVERASAELAPAPHQLPPAPRHFAGRGGETDSLTELLERAQPPRGTVVIVAIHGQAGIGKTALALSWAHQISDRFPDGQLFINLRGYDPSRGMIRGKAGAGA